MHALVETLEKEYTEKKADKALIKRSLIAIQQTVKLRAPRPLATTKEAEQKLEERIQDERAAQQKIFARIDRANLTVVSAANSIMRLLHQLDFVPANKEDARKHELDEGILLAGAHATTVNQLSILGIKLETVLAIVLQHNLESPQHLEQSIVTDLSLLRPPSFLNLNNRIFVKLEDEKDIKGKEVTEKIEKKDNDDFYQDYKKAKLMKKLALERAYACPRIFKTSKPRKGN